MSYLNKVTILKDERICRGHLTEICRGHLIENSLDEQLIENDKKKVKQDKETEICSYSPIAFLHKYQYKVQYPCAEELSRKCIKDGNMDVIFCNQYAWTDSMIEVPKKNYSK